MIKKLIGAVVGLSILFGVWFFFHLLVNNKLSIGYNKGYQPDQPLPFSHKFHSGELELDCKYCHASAEVSRHSAIPSLNVCMNCHINLNKQSKYLDQLKEAYNSGDSISWVKIHMLPDHVKFPHANHIKAGKDCQTCHGPVQNMEKVYQYSDLSMGWCINCHRETMESSHGSYLKEPALDASTNSSLDILNPSPKNSNISTHGETSSGMTDYTESSSSSKDEKWTPSIINCSTCHY